MDAPFFLAIKLIIQDYCLNYNPVIYYTVFILPFLKLWLWENMFTFIRRAQITKFRDIAVFKI